MQKLIGKLLKDPDHGKKNSSVRNSELQHDPSAIKCKQDSQDRTNIKTKNMANVSAPPLLKSPSDTTLYAPALNKGNNPRRAVQRTFNDTRQEFDLIDQISNFVE